MTYKINSYRLITVLCLLLMIGTVPGNAAPVQDLEELSLSESVQIVVNNATQQKMRNIPELVFRTHKAYHTLDKIQSLINVHKEYSKGLNMQSTDTPPLFSSPESSTSNILAATRLPRVFDIIPFRQNDLIIWV